MARPGNAQPSPSRDLSRPQHYGRPIPLARLAHCNARPSTMVKASASKFFASKAARSVLTQNGAISIWFNKSAASQGALWAAFRAASDDGYFAVVSLSDGRLRVSGWVTNYKITTQAWATGWTHVMVRILLGASTLAERVAMFVNGVRITAFSTDTGPATLEDDWLNLSIDYYVGDTAPLAGGTEQFDGDLAECALYDDCPVDIGPEYFGQRVGPLWVPRRPFIPAGGRRGFYLPLEAGSGLDASENGTSLTPTAVTAGTLQRVAAVYGA